MLLLLRFVLFLFFITCSFCEACQKPVICLVLPEHMKSDDDFIDALDEHQEKIRALKYETMVVFTEPVTSKELIHKIHDAYEIKQQRNERNFTIAGIEIFGHVMTTVFSKKLSGQSAYAQLMYYDFEKDHDSSFCFTSHTNKDRIQHISCDQKEKLPPPKQWVSQHLAGQKSFTAECLTALTDDLPSKADYISSDSNKLGTEFNSDLALKMNRALTLSNQRTHWTTHASCMMLCLALGYYLFTNLDMMFETIARSEKKIRKFSSRPSATYDHLSDRLSHGELAESSRQAYQIMQKKNRYQQQYANTLPIVGLSCVTITSCIGAFIYSATSLFNSLKTTPPSWQQILAKAYLTQSGLALDES